jgi:D-methionine transport system substrate-binding protein
MENFMQRMLAFLAFGLVFGFGGILWGKDAIRVGAIKDDFKNIYIEKAAEIAARDGLTTEIIYYFSSPDSAMALENKEIDLDFGQTNSLVGFYSTHYSTSKPVSVGNTYVDCPMGFYSKKIKSLDELKKGDTLALSTGAFVRSISVQILHHAGIIKLQPFPNYYPQVHNIADNPLKLRFKEIDQVKMAKRMNSFAAVSMGCGYAAASGLDPIKDAIALEDGKSKDASVMAAREENMHDPKILRFVKAFQNQEMAEFIIGNIDLNDYNSINIPAFSYEESKEKTKSSSAPEKQ